MSALLPASWPDWARHVAKLAALGVVFGVAGYAIGHYIAELFPELGPLPDFRWADVAAVILAFALIVAAVGTALVAFNRQALGRILKLEGPAGAGEVRDARLQAAVLVLSGVALALPPVLSGLGVGSTIAFGAVVVLLVVHTLLNLRLYRTVDELFRRTVVEAGALTFWAGQGVLFLWAAAERLALAPPLTAWDIFVVLMGVYLPVSAIVTIRRGLA